MKQPFSEVSHIHSAEELIDLAFRRASQVRVTVLKRVPTIVKVRQKELTRITTVKQILTDRLKKPLEEIPKIDELHPFYRELVDVLVGVDRLKKSLGALNWAVKMIGDLADRYTRRARGTKTISEAANVRKEAYGRIASIIKQISGELNFLREARERLTALPSIDPEMLTLVVAGYANVGKSTFVKQVSTAKPEIATYPFTTKEIIVGHRDTAHGRCQIIDTPGLLDRPLSGRNRMELQAIIALRHLADVIVFMTDPSETCGYPFDRQISLYREISKEFSDIPIIGVINKVDLTSRGRIEEAKNVLGASSFEAVSSQNVGVQEIFEEALKKAVEKKATP